MKIKLGKMGVKGFVKLEVIRDGKVIREHNDTNLITSLGCRAIPIGMPFAIEEIGVGSSSKPAKLSDTSLGSAITRSSSVNKTYSNSGSPDYIRKVTCVTTFQPGQATGDVREVGFYGSSKNYNPTIPGGYKTRSVLRDHEGTPITVVVEPQDALRVTYVIQVQQDMSSGTGTIELSGNKGGTFNYSIEPLVNGIIGDLNNATVASPEFAGETGGFTKITPSYSVSGDIVTLRAVSVTGNLNFEGGIKRIRISGSNVIGYEITLDDPIPKTDRDILSMSFEIDFNQTEDPD